MSGHSKWSTIKHKKEKIDAERGRVFTKLIREVTVAARHGGGDMNANPRLRSAVQAAKAANMPATNIDRAIKKGTGELPGVVYEEVIYEGYGPGGVAILVEVMTDNKNRTVADIRHIFARNGGNMGEAGCVNWLFEKRGVIYVDKDKANEDDLMMIALDAGALDVRTENGAYEIITLPDKFEEVKSALEKNKLEYSQAEITMLPQNTVRLEGKDAEQALKLVEVIEEHEDVQKVHANFDIDEEIMERISAEKG